MSRKGVIGRAGKLPWHLPEDLAHFKRLTLGHAIIMGRRTFDEVGRPLPNRRNIVVSRQAKLVLPGCKVVPSMEEAIRLALATDPEPRVIGGAEIYRLALPFATNIYLTEAERAAEGDTTFPAFDRSAWRETERRKGDGVSFVTLERSPRAG